MATAAVPAWKRLGLKLKYADQDAPDSRKTSRSSGNSLVREREDNPSISKMQTDSPQPLKKKRKTEKHETASTQMEDANTFSDQILPSATDGDEAKSKRPKKQVSFSSDTKSNVDMRTSSAAQLHPADSVGPKKPKSKSKSKLAKQQPSVQKSNPALDYLSQYYTARSSWKFNKNRETWLLKHIFSVADVPHEYEIPLAKYIHGLQGSNSRQRLKTESEKRLKDEASSVNGENSHQEDPKKDEEYRLRFLRELESQESASNMEDVDGRDEYHRWIQRQNRAEILLWALQGTSLLTSATGLERPLASNTKEKKRKNRTTIIEYESSSSSSSDSDSDSDDASSSSSDDTSSGEESSES